MPVAATRLEILQLRKLIQCVRTKDDAQVTKMAEVGIEGLLNFQGEGAFSWLESVVCHELVLSGAGMQRCNRECENFI